MQWLDDIVYTNEFLESLDKDCFPLTYKMCSKNKFDTGSVIVRKLVNQEIDHPIAIVIYEERPDNAVHIYCIEVHKKCQGNGRKLIDKFKEKYDKITLCSLPETKLFYIKRGFEESEENRMVWVRPKSIKERYAKIAQSEWFKKAYENQSIGEVIEVEDND